MPRPVAMLLAAWLATCSAVVMPPRFTRRSIGAAAGAALFGGAPQSALLSGHPVAAMAATATAPLRAPPQPGVLSPLCDPSVSVIRIPATGQMVVIVGTAHISEDSVSLVREVRR